VDVMEVDAASRTGVDDIREILDGVRYRPVAARHKVYIIDEVHMLSRNAFNALLKTLEEPPPHVIFIFATTEIRKVPVTVLSRCMRFDLRRIESGALAGYLAEVAGKEGASLDAGAARMLARAADGSVRDGLSLLDQALALVGDRAPAAVAEADIRGMLGFADRGLVIDLFDAILKGDPRAALAQIAGLYEAGADPATILRDLLELTHGLAALKVAPDAPLADAVGEAERPRLVSVAGTLRLSVLTRAWQMLLKGLGETRVAPDPRAALEMVAIRLIYAAELPTPAEVITTLAGAAPKGAEAPAGGASTTVAPMIGEPMIGAPTMGAPTTGRAGGGAARHAGGGGFSGRGGREGSEARRIDMACNPAPAPFEARRADQGPMADLAPGPAPSSEPHADARGVADPQSFADPRSFAEAVRLFSDRREAALHTHLRNDVHLVRFEPGRIELAPGPYAPASLANRVGDLLSQWTGRRWVVSISNATGGTTLREQEQAAAATQRAVVLRDPLLQAVLRVFPGAAVETVRAPPAVAPHDEPSDDALEPPDDDPTADDGDHTA